MNYQEQKYRKKILLGESSNHLMILIAVCLILFVGFAFMKAVWFFKYPKEVALANYYADVLTWFTLPADFKNFLSKPWTIITNMFVHDNVWKVFANMLWLWCFGYILQHISGNKKIVPVFIYGSLGGAMAFMLAYNFIPSLQPQLPYAGTLGASAGVMAVAITATMTSPGYRIFPLIGGGIPLWAITALYIISDLATISFSETGYLISHLAGALTGVIFVLFLRMGYDWSKGINNFFDWISNLFNPDRPKKGKTPKEELFYRSSSAPFKKTSNMTQQRIDEILDKINQHGYDHLTDEEKELLKKASREKL
ncbi:MAG: rhomboid family intramembrane serine protease [Sphingobacteriales bacterium]|nr:rhomboid family intramembrane serine protease [Sphingobacteriales bacterium]